VLIFQKSVNLPILFVYSLFVIQLKNGINLIMEEERIPISQKSFESEGGGGELSGKGVAPVKTINFLGSMALIANNITGPAMMGLPLIYRQAGILPTTACILICWVLSSFGGTLLSETIQNLKGNQKFDKNIDFSYAFSKVVGKKWRTPVSVLVIISCGVNCIAGIVATSQSLDSFIASFILGKTYAIEVSYTNGFGVATWDSSGCKHASLGTDGVSIESKSKECTPFHNVHNSNIITLGYFVMFCIFYPLGTHDLKETITAEIFSFFAFFFCIFQFLREFQDTGYPYISSVPLIGNDMKQLAGVVLFNYAYGITIPSWLNEKKTNVSVNKIIWTSSAISTLCYIVFGILGAASFNKPGDDILVTLASNKTSSLTQFAAAFFGLCMIGTGVPIFCVIVKNSLFQIGLFDLKWSTFYGSLFPYLISWYMYQGKSLIEMVNWTGLLVSGLVAFILPYIFALFAYNKKNNVRGIISSPSLNIVTTGTSKSLEASNAYKYSSIDKDEEDGRTSDDNSVASTIYHDDENIDKDNDNRVEVEENILVNPLLSSCLEPLRKTILIFGIFIFCCIISSTLVINLESPPPSVN